MIVVFILLVKTAFTPQNQAYIVWPENPNFVERVKFQMDQFQKDAQDLPANVEMQIKRLWKEVKPGNEAKLV